MLNAEQLIERLQVEIDDYLIEERISPVVADRKSTPAYLLYYLNRADIEITSLVDKAAVPDTLTKSEITAGDIAGYSVGTPLEAETWLIRLTLTHILPYQLVEEDNLVAQADKAREEYFVRYSTTVDDVSGVISRIQSYLKDLRFGKGLTEDQFRQKSNPEYLLYFLNRADIDICSLIKESATVCLYVQKGMDRLPLDVKGLDDMRYTIGLLRDGAFKKDLARVDYWLNDTKYVDVQSVISNRVTLYDAVSVTKEFSDGLEYHATAKDQFHSNRYSHQFYFEKGTKRLFLRPGLPSNGYLMFDGHIYPAALEPKKITADMVDEYEVRTPDVAEEWLFYQTLSKVLPFDLVKEHSLIERSEKERFDYERRRTAGPTTIYTPESDYSFT